MDQSVGLVLLLGLIAIGVFFLVRKREKLKQRNQQGNREPESLSGSASDIRTMIEVAKAVVGAYGAVLEQNAAPSMSLRSESTLVHPKIEIRKCIEFLLLGPLEEMQRNHLEVGNVLLNDFIPEAEYRGIEKHQAGLNKVLEFGAAGDKDAKKLASLMVESITPESEILMKQIQDRIELENKATIERHRSLRNAVSKTED